MGVETGRRDVGCGREGHAASSVGFSGGYDASGKGARLGRHTEIRTDTLGSALRNATTPPSRPYGGFVNTFYVTS